MTLNQPDIPENVLVEENYEGKINEGRVTIYSEKGPVIAHLEDFFKSREFTVSYLTESTVWVEKQFSMVKPLERLAAIRFTFFEYSDHVIVYYTIHRIYGLSVVTMVLAALYLLIAGIWLASYWQQPGAWKTTIPFLILVAAFAYQQGLHLRVFKKVVHNALDGL